MKYAVLADIHSNLTALQAVLADISARGGVQETWCLGDIVGYGPDPHECLATMRQHNAVCIAGNHDLAAIGAISTSDFNADAAAAARWTGRQLNAQDASFLRQLPEKIEVGQFTLAHGSPRSPIWEYLLSPREAEQNLAWFKTPYCLVGHTHAPLVFECNAKGKCSMRIPGADKPIRLLDRRLIINPGGIGQPRDRDPRASYAVYDSDTQSVTIRRVEYNIASVQARMAMMGLPDRLIERLAYGI